MRPLAKTLPLGKLPACTRKTNRPKYSLCQASLPVVPNKVRWGDKCHPEMFLNDRIGCCAISAIAENIKVCTANRFSEAIIQDEWVLDKYRQISGYDPSLPSSDIGCYLDDVMGNINKEGFAGYRIKGWCESAPGNLYHLRAGIYMFGAAYVGLALPMTAQKQWDKNKTWDVVKTSSGEDQPGSWGYHCVLTPSYGFKNGLFGYHYYDCLTWGSRQRMTPAFIERYQDECHFLLWTCWYRPSPAPNGIDPAKLEGGLLLL